MRVDEAFLAAVRERAAEIERTKTFPSGDLEFVRFLRSIAHRLLRDWRESRYWQLNKMAEHYAWNMFDVASRVEREIELHWQNVVSTMMGCLRQIEKIKEAEIREAMSPRNRAKREREEERQALLRRIGK